MTDKPKHSNQPKRGRNPGSQQHNHEGNPDLEFIVRRRYVTGKEEYGLCGAVYYVPQFEDYITCDRYKIKPGGRCGRHGGLSTGPRTEAGRRRSAQGAARYAEQQRLLREAGSGVQKGSGNGVSDVHSAGDDDQGGLPKEGNA